MMSDKKELNELSSGTLASYTIKAAAAKRENLSKATAGMARANGQKGEPEVRGSMHKKAIDYVRKAHNRHEGIKKATTKLAKKPETAGVCEDVEQIDELSNDKLKAYGRAAMKSVEHLQHKADALSSASYTKGVLTNKETLGKSLETSAKAEVRKNYIRKAAAKINPGAARDNNNFNKYAKHYHNSTNTKTLSKQYKRMAGVTEEVDMINESKKDSPEAKHQYDRLMGAAGTVGSHRGSVRVYFNHKGGQLQHTMVGEVNHYSYGTNKSGHHFAQRYSARPGHEFHTYAHFPQKTDFRDHEHIHAEVERQNPHAKGTGHAWNLSNDIIKHHGDNNLIREEIEQIDELSRDTLKRYINKSRIAQKNHNRMADAHTEAAYNISSVSKKAADRHHMTAMHHDHKAVQRATGREMAVDKLSKRVPKKDGLASVKEQFQSQLQEQFKKKGRPKKARHEDGKIVNDPNA